MPKNKSWFEIKASTEGAEIFIYDEIGSWGIRAKDFVSELKAFTGLNQITVRINSPGGSVFDGTAIYNLLKNHSATIKVKIDGLAASMASVIAMAGDSIEMPENAIMMIHNPWMFAGGDAAELRKSADVLDKIKASILSAYTSKTGLSEDELSAMMDAETWLTGAEAKKLGFADDLTPAVDVAAAFDLSKFKNAPKTISQLSAVADAVTTPKEDAEMPTPNPPVTPEIQTLDAAQIAMNAKAEAAARIASINTVFAQFPQHNELAMKCILDQHCTVEQAQARLLKALGEREEPTATGSIKVEDTGAQACVKAMADVLGARVGLAAGKPLTENPFRGASLMDMARNTLEKRGFSVTGMDKMAIVAAAFTHTSGDFGTLLSNTARKMMLKGYDEVEETFTRFTSVGNLPDFKSMTKVDINAAPSLRKVREGAEYKSITMGERGESVQLATYGELFGITRQAIINDDLDVFTRIPRNMGRAARRTVGDLVYAILTGNPVMGDGKTLFHADHANLMSTAALAVDKISAARVAMGKQKDASGNATLNIRPSYLIVPLALEDLALQLMTSETDPSKTNSRIPNTVRGAAEVIADARLDADSATTWYALASPSMYDTIEVQYLDGNPNPTLEQQAGWNVDGVEFKVRIDAGAKALDHRTLLKATA